MSNSLGLHDPTLVRIFKLSNAENAVVELKNFLSKQIALVILGEFPDSAVHIETADFLCKERQPEPAVLWIKDSDIITAVTPLLKEKAVEFSTVNFNSVLALAFKMNTEEVVYLIEKNPANWRRKMSLLELQRALAATIAITNNQA